MLRFSGGGLQIDDIRGLCGELVELGILRRVTEERFTLRSVNILNMLGTWETIDRRLDELAEKQFNLTGMYNSLQRRNSFSNANMEDSQFAGQAYPLTIQQINYILEASGVHLVLGTKTLGLDGVAACVKQSLGFDKNARSLIYLNALPQDPQSLGKNRVILILPECQWTVEEVLKLDKALDVLTEEDRPVVLVLCNEERILSLLSENKKVLLSIPFIQLSRWSQEAVQAWLGENNKDGILLNSSLKQITAELSGWPDAIYRFGKCWTENQASVPDIQALLATTKELLRKEGMYDRMVSGVASQPLARKILEMFYIFSDEIDCKLMVELLRSDISGDETDISLKRVETLVSWMEYQGLLHRSVKRDKSLKKAGDDQSVQYFADPLLLSLWPDQQDEQA